MKNVGTTIAGALMALVVMACCMSDAQAKPKSKRAHSSAHKACITPATTVIYQVDPVIQFTAEEQKLALKEEYLGRISCDLSYNSDPVERLHTEARRYMALNSSAWALYKIRCAEYLVDKEIARQSRDVHESGGKWDKHRCF